MDSYSVTHDDLVIGEADYRPELVTVSLTGTGASVTSESGETDDDSTKTLKLTVTDGTGESWDGVEQTITYPAATDTALEKAAAINDQGKGIHADVDGSGHVVIVTDKTGSSVSIAIGEGTATMVWGTEVAGTGSNGVLDKGTLLARNSSTSKLVPYVSGGSTGIGTPVAVLPQAYTWASTGDKKLDILFGGRVLQSKLIAHGVGAITTAEAQSLMSNSNVIPVISVATGA
jgi:hypothetical protein